MNDKILDNLKQLQTIISSKKLDGFFIDGSDGYLNEYVPLGDNNRYYLSGFTGSTGYLLVTTKKNYLIVDGRYHQQADSEVDQSLIEVIKCPRDKRIFDLLLEKIKESSLKNVGIEGDKTRLTFKLKLDDICKVSVFSDGEIDAILNKEMLPKKMEDAYGLPIDVVGKSIEEKIKQIIDQDQFYYISLLDSVSWITNLRGFHLPNQSSIQAKALVTFNKIYLFVIDDFIIKGINANIVEIVKIKNSNDLKQKLKDISSQNGSVKIKVCFKDVTVADLQILNNVFGKNNLIDDKNGVTQYQTIKNRQEIETMRKSFAKSNNAIFESVLWLKDVGLKNSVSEKQFYNKVGEFFSKQGAIDQSFNTIAAFGSNSSIIHFSDPSDDKIIQPNEMALLDCGAYYSDGYATDTTRTFLVGDKASDRQREIYTLVLKGVLNAQAAVFPYGTTGSQIDFLARQAMYKVGLDYNHSTGHGIGINVHEGGVGISSASKTSLKIGQVVSIEPGLYFENFGGVRLENAVVVINHPKFEDMLCFDQFVYIGYDHQLINYEMLDSSELIALTEYEKKCQKLGLSFK